jgi:hypothetical protein
MKPPKRWEMRTILSNFRLVLIFRAGHYRHLYGPLYYLYNYFVAIQLPKSHCTSQMPRSPGSLDPSNTDQALLFHHQHLTTIATTTQQWEAQNNLDCGGTVTLRPRIGTIQGLKYYEKLFVDHRFLPCPNRKEFEGLHLDVEFLIT